jgi:hypothetical protein
MSYLVRIKQNADANFAEKIMQKKLSKILTSLIACLKIYPSPSYEKVNVIITSSYILFYLLQIYPSDFLNNFAGFRF